jgi:hypothetical protein
LFVAGVAVSVTTVPLTGFCAHVPDFAVAVIVQLNPAPVTVPVPAFPAAGSTVSAKVTGAGVNVAIIDRACDIVTTHAPVPEQTPLHPPNESVPFGVAVSVTTVPCVYPRLHVPVADPEAIAQSIPPTFDVTRPLPVPAPTTVSV